MRIINYKKFSLRLSYLIIIILLKKYISILMLTKNEIMKLIFILLKSIISY